MILNCFNYIVESGDELPRVEVGLFPFPEYKKYVIRSIRLDESLVKDFIDRAMNVYEANRIGPVKYLDTYKKYSDLISNKAHQDVTSFLQMSQNELEDFEVQIDKYTKIKKEITVMIVSVPLNLYQLECNSFHENLRDRIQLLKDLLVQFCVDLNRETNKS